MERRNPDRERTGIAQILAIGLVLAVALWAGLTLLGKTRSTWETHRSERKTQAASIRAAANNSESYAIADRRRRVEEMRQRAVADAREHYRKELEAGRIRCINGQLFKRLPNGWENVPGQRCH